MPCYHSFFLITVVNCFSLFTFSECSAHVQECSTNSYDVIEQTNMNFKKFERDLNSYFLYLDQTAEKEKNNAYGCLLIKNKEELKESVKASNEIFLELRQKFRDIVFSKYGNYPDTNSEAIAVDAELTSWYITYMKATLLLEETQKQKITTK